MLSETGEAIDWLPVGYAGGMWDRDTSLTRFGVRDYDPSIGRWTATDPIRFRGGDANIYNYCLGEPVNHVDPDGRNPWVWVIVGAGVAGVVAVIDQQAIRSATTIHPIRIALPNVGLWPRLDSAQAPPGARPGSAPDSTTGPLYAVEDDDECPPTAPLSDYTTAESRKRKECHDRAIAEMNRSVRNGYNFIEAAEEFQRVYEECMNGIAWTPPMGGQ